VLPTSVSDALLLVIALSMLLTPLFFLAYDQLAKMQKSTDAVPEHDQIDE